jgi:hypothetical protein
MPHWLVQVLAVVLVLWLVCSVACALLFHHTVMPERGSVEWHLRKAETCYTLRRRQWHAQMANTLLIRQSTERVDGLLSIAAREGTTEGERDA